jgi:hypothetical protein
MSDPQIVDTELSFADRMEFQLGKHGVRALHAGHAGAEEVCGRCASEIALYLDSQLMATHELRLENEKLRDSVALLAETQKRLDVALAQLAHLESEYSALKTIMEVAVDDVLSGYKTS